MEVVLSLMTGVTERGLGGGLVSTSSQLRRYHGRDNKVQRDLQVVSCSYSGYHRRFASGLLDFERTDELNDSRASSFYSKVGR